MEETTSKGEGGGEDSKYDEYSEKFFLFVSLRVGSMNTGRPYFDNF